MTLNPDAPRILNHHAEHLMSSLLAVNDKLNKDKKEPFLTKEIDTLTKAINSGKTTDQEKFPHLSPSKVQEYGEKCRMPMSVAHHFMDFQRKTIKTLGDIVNESKNLDLQWNYIFTLEVLKLYSYYVRLHILVNNIENFEKSVQVYNYCLNTSDKTPYEEAEEGQFVEELLKERRTYRNIISELQILKEPLFSVFKTIITTLSRILSSGPNFQWSLLNINDNPEPFENKSAFLKLDYIVLIHLKDILNAFIAYALINTSVIENNKEFLDVFCLIHANSPKFILSGHINVDLKATFYTFRKVNPTKKKDHNDGDIFASGQNKTDVLKYSIKFRIRKLSMILAEYSSAAAIDTSVICNKLPVILAVLGFSNYEIFERYTNYEEGADFSVAALVGAAIEIVSVMQDQWNFINRFIIYNFREYDKPLLENLLTSLPIPMEARRRFEWLRDFLGKIDIEAFDKGKQIHLIDATCFISRQMSWFNHFSTSHGIRHLYPFFNHLSAMYFRMLLFDGKLEFLLKIINLHQLWAYTPQTISIMNRALIELPDHSPWVLYLPYFLTWNRPMLMEVSQFEALINKQYDDLKVAAVRAITTVSVRILWGGAMEARTFRPARRLMDILFKIKSVTIFDKRRPILDDVVEQIGGLPSVLISKIPQKSPFGIKEQLRTIQDILRELMLAAHLAPNPWVHLKMQRLRRARIDKKAYVVGKQLGAIPQRFVSIYKAFIGQTINSCMYSPATEAFELKEGATAQVHPREVATPLALQTLYEVGGVKTLAVIDILAADAVAATFKEFVSLAESSKVLSLVKEQFNPDNQAFAKNILSSEIYALNAPKLLQLFCRAGALQMFRTMIRRAPFFSADDRKRVRYLTRPFDGRTPDVVLNARLAKTPIAELAQKDIFGVLVGLLFMSPSLYSMVAAPSTCTFDNNIHCVGRALDAAIGASLATNYFLPERTYGLFYRNAWFAINFGLQGKKQRKAVWPYDQLLIALDTIARNTPLASNALLDEILAFPLLKNIRDQLLRNNAA